MIKNDLRKGKVDITKVAEKVKEVRHQTINNYKRAEVIVMTANGKSRDKIAYELGINRASVDNIRKQNRELIARIEKDIASVSLEKEAKLINKFLDILDIKADRMAEDTEIIDTTKATEISGTIKDLHNKMLLDQGRATSITEYKNKSEGELLADLKEATILLEQGDKRALLKAVFDNE